MFPTFIHDFTSFPFQSSLLPDWTKINFFFVVIKWSKLWGTKASISSFSSKYVAFKCLRYCIRHLFFLYYWSLFPSLLLNYYWTPLKGLFEIKHVTHKVFYAYVELFLALNNQTFILNFIYLYKLNLFKIVFTWIKRKLVYPN